MRLGEVALANRSESVGRSRRDGPGDCESEAENELCHRLGVASGLVRNCKLG